MTVAQSVLRGLSGYSTLTSVVVNVLSLRPGAANGGADAVLNINGQNYNIALTRFANDRPSAITTAYESNVTWAGYQGSQIVPDLDPLTSYPYTITQTGSPTFNGTTMSAAQAWQDYCALFLSCDRGEAVTGGFFKFIQEYVQTPGSLPCAGMVFHDDFGYADNATVSDAAGSGHVSTSSSKTAPQKVYNYALAHMQYLGMMGDADVAGTTSQVRTALGRNDYRHWCFSNLNLLPQWGDHEFNNNYRYDTAQPIDAALEAAAKGAWDKIFYPLQPPSRGAGISVRDTTANHWAWDCGAARFVASDGITNGNQTGANYYANYSPSNVMFGQNQIYDLRDAWNVAAPFKVLTSWMGARKLIDDPKPFLGSYGDKQPLFDAFLHEWKQLFTDAATTGGVADAVMKNDKTNGTSGNFVVLHGDEHLSRAMLHHAPASAGNLAEKITWVTAGISNADGTSAGDEQVLLSGDIPIAGFQYKPAATMGAYGYPYADGLTPVSTTLFAGCKKGPYNSGAGALPTSLFYGCRVEVYGSRNPKEMHIHILDDQGNTLWSRKWVQYLTGNEGCEVSETKQFRRISRGEAI